MERVLSLCRCDAAVMVRVAAVSDTTANREGTVHRSEWRERCMKTEVCVGWSTKITRLSSNAKQCVSMYTRMKQLILYSKCSFGLSQHVSLL